MSMNRKWDQLKSPEMLLTVADSEVNKKFLTPFLLNHSYCFLVSF